MQIRLLLCGFIHDRVKTQYNFGEVMELTYSKHTKLERWDSNGTEVVACGGRTGHA